MISNSFEEEEEEEELHVAARHAFAVHAKKSPESKRFDSGDALEIDFDDWQRRMAHGALRQRWCTRRSLRVTVLFAFSPDRTEARTTLCAPP